MSYQVAYAKKWLPAVSRAQNGTGANYQLDTVYDEAGRVIWRKSPRGFISSYRYDPATGAMTRKVEDVQTTGTPGVPAGWVTPAGGGLDLQTDYEVDGMGRVVKELGPPHQVQLYPGQEETTEVRQVLFTVYLEAQQEVRRAKGYATGVAGSYSYTTVGAVVIERRVTDPMGYMDERVEAVRANNSGAPTALETFPRSSWRKWSQTSYDQWGRAKQGQVYHKIPEAGPGSQGTNYELVDYGYDEMGRQVRLKDETGTIQRTVYDVRGLVVQNWAGTDDAGATNGDPSGSGAPGNNMRLVLVNEYDNGLPGGNGYLTKITKKVNGDPAEDRIEEREYNFEGLPTKVTTSDGVRDLIDVYGYDGQGRVVERVRYRDVAAAGHYLGKVNLSYDSNGRIYQELMRGADEATGNLSAMALAVRKWYDASGNLIKEKRPQSDAATKYVYDGADRNRARYVVLEGSSSSSSSSGGSWDPPTSSSSSSGGSWSNSSASSSSSSSSSSGPDPSPSPSPSGPSPSPSGPSPSPSGPSPSPSGPSPSPSGPDPSPSPSSSSSSGPGPSPSPSPSSSSSSGPPEEAPECGPCEGEEGEGVGETSNPGTEECDGSGGGDGNSGNPIHYADGALIYEAVDLEWRGFSFRWGQTRSYANQMVDPGNGLNGHRWLSKQLSRYLPNQGNDGESAVVVTGARTSKWYRTAGGGGGGGGGGGVAYLMPGRFGSFSSLRVDNTEVAMELADGTKKVYYSYAAAVPGVLRGQLKRLVDRAGKTAVLAYSADGRVSSLGWSEGGRSVSFNYDYYPAGDDRAGRIWAITQWLDGEGLRRVVYDYYVEGDAGGEAGDLKVAVIEGWNASTASWEELRRNFYRYYKRFEAKGFVHGLKYIVGHEGCRRMQQAGINSETASNEVLLSYSDYYFEYDWKQRVVLEKVRGGTQTHTFEYQANTASPGLAAVNVWAMKTTESLPDGNKVIVYTNKGGKAILHILRRTSDGASWCRFREYNPEYQVALLAEPSSIESVTEPVGGTGPLTVVLKADSGLVRKYSHNSGEALFAPGRLNFRTAQQGSGGGGGGGGRRVSYGYGSHTAGSGASIYPRTQEIVDPEGPQEAVTRYQFDYYGGGTAGSPPSGGGGGTPANSIAGDEVFLQEEQEFDPAGNVILASRDERFHDATGLGELYGPNAPAGKPKGRRSYMAYWPDGIGRVRVTANYGTNGGAELVRGADEIAPEGSDIILVSRTTFKDDGDANATIDPMGVESRWENDAVGRRTKLVENYVAGGGTAHDENRTTYYEYHADSQLKRLLVVNAVTGDQVTEWRYGVTLAGGSEIADNHLLAAKVMADGGEYLYEYNRQEETIRYQDPNLTVHHYAYDLLGRMTGDEAEIDASMIDVIDGWVTRLTRSYTAKGLVHKVTSLSSGGGVINQVEMAYNDWGQLAKDRQAHSGAVDGSTREVAYSYQSVPNQVRLGATTYPSGRKMIYKYDYLSVQNDRLGRVDALIAETGGESEVITTYRYCGFDRFVEIRYIPVDVELTYINQLGEPGNDAGDPYTGWDRFGRTQDMRWRKGGGDIERVQYGYDRASRRTWRASPLVPWNPQDEAYQYDGLDQLTGFARGGLNVNHTAIGGIPHTKEAIDYDPIGNWQEYQIWDHLGAPLADQTRVHNTSNMLTQVDGSSARVAHDANGNMTKDPLLWPEGSGTPVLVWDAWDRLVKMNQDDIGTLYAEYQYDGLSRMTRTASPGIDPTYYYYNNLWRPVEEYEGEAAVRAYDWGIRYRDDLIRRWREWPGEYNYALHDYYNVTAITDGSGEVVERYGYSGFGEVRFMTADYIDKISSDLEWNLLYKAQFRDSATDYYNYGYRWFSPKLGTWISRDPIEEEGGINLYAFCKNDTPNHNDILGAYPMAYNYSPEIAEKMQKDEEARRRKHLDRNKHNECPKTQPWGSNIDSKGRTWTRDDKRGEDMFHGGLCCYRHEHFQCCYDSGGDIVNSGPYQGTYDYEKFDPATGEGRMSHTTEDVIPHWTIGSNYTDNLTTLYDW